MTAKPTGNPTGESTGDAAGHRGETAGQGVVKTYDPATGVGIVVTDAGDEVFLRAGSLAGSIFRFVRQGQRIVFDLTDDGDRRYAFNVRMGQEGY